MRRGMLILALLPTVGFGSWDYVNMHPTTAPYYSSVIEQSHGSTFTGTIRAAADSYFETIHWLQPNNTSFVTYGFPGKSLFPNSIGPGISVGNTTLNEPYVIFPSLTPFVSSFFVDGVSSQRYIGVSNTAPRAVYTSSVGAAVSMFPLVAGNTRSDAFATWGDATVGYCTNNANNPLIGTLWEGTTVANTANNLIPEEIVGRSMILLRQTPSGFVKYYGYPNSSTMETLENYYGVPLKVYGNSILSRSQKALWVSSPEVPWNQWRVDENGSGYFSFNPQTLSSDSAYWYVGGSRMASSPTRTNAMLLKRPIFEHSGTLLRSDSFDGYAAGPLAGQPGWTVIQTNSGTFSTSAQGFGIPAKGLTVQPNLGTGASYAFMPLATRYNSATDSDKVVVASMRIRIEGNTIGTGTTTKVGFTGWDGAASLGGIMMDAKGYFYHVDGNTSNRDGFIEGGYSDAWVHLAVEFNFATKKLTGYVNGIPVFLRYNFNPTTFSGLTDVDITVNNGAQRVHIDDYKVIKRPAINRVFVVVGKQDFDFSADRKIAGVITGPGGATYPISDTPFQFQEVHVQGNGNYSLLIKGEHHLAKRVNFTLLDNDVSVFADMVNGDVNGDNEIGPSDFAILASKFGLDSSSPDFVVGADLNGDMEVGPSDFAILANNFGLEGDS